MENKNSVCYIASVTEVTPLEGADKIVGAKVNGWPTIIARDEYNVGDYVVIFADDAIIPQELVDYLGVSKYLRSGNRVHTVKFNKFNAYSTCLVASVEKIRDYLNTDVDLTEGKDLMELLGVKKYEESTPQTKLNSSSAQSVPKSNPFMEVYYKFPNLQNVPDMFSEDDDVQITRKIHGTNARYGILKKSSTSLKNRFKKLLRLKMSVADEYEFVYGSHNRVLGKILGVKSYKGFYSDNVWSQVAQEQHIPEKLLKLAQQLYDLGKLGNGIELYGEIYGPGIQKNYTYGLKNLEFAAFDIEIDNKYIPQEDTLNYVNQMGLLHVPVLYEGKYSDAVRDQFTYDYFMSDGMRIPHEGIVIKAVDGNRQKTAKFKNPDFLIYAEKHNVSDGH